MLTTADGRSLSPLAQELDVDQTTLMQYPSGRRPISIKTYSIDLVFDTAATRARKRWARFWRRDPFIQVNARFPTLLTVPLTVIPASCAFRMHRSASAQYPAWSRPEFFFMSDAEVETIIRMRSGPTPSFFSSIARSTARSRIVIAVSSRSPACFAIRLLARISLRSVSASANFDCELILEGIESEATAVAAAGIGINYGQGYHFSRPAPAGYFMS